MVCVCVCLSDRHDTQTVPRVRHENKRFLRRLANARTPVPTRARAPSHRVPREETGTAENLPEASALWNTVANYSDTLTPLLSLCFYCGINHLPRPGEVCVCVCVCVRERE